MKQCKTLFLIFVALLFSSAVTAHTGLLKSSPSDGAMMTTSPDHLMMQFGAPVRLVKLTLFDENNQPTDINFSPTRNAQKTFKQPLPQLAPSRYKVKWVAMGGDSHKIEGQFQFHVHGDNASHAHHH